MKNRFFVPVILMLLVVSCGKIEIIDEVGRYDNWAIFTNSIPIKATSFFDYLKPNKDKLDMAVEDYYSSWKASGKDSTECVVDFAEIVPFEWDTICYFWYNTSYEHYPQELKDYAKEHNIQRYWESLHFLKGKNVVFVVNLELNSEKERGVLFCTDKNIIKRARGDAKFHVRKLDCFYIIRDMTEEFMYNWRYIDEEQYDRKEMKLRNKNKGNIEE